MFYLRNLLFVILFFFYFFFFFNDTATTEIYTRSIVGSVRCVQETGTWDLGLYVFEADVVCEDGDVVSFDTDDSYVKISDAVYQAKPLSNRMKEILSAGGLNDYLSWQGEP
eukprot:TRINITY_DN22867_c0_g1_i1.p4 TRINITY_DN22867_c0_g1~~TRINITY_DN22867_c0_g1_i1.p4  ORF type:complete len:111 (+),score=36.89 TRINITY_DN22867_c0_g1_i1:56-388(+)